MSAGEVRALDAREGRRLVRIEGFEPALFVTEADKDAYDRRFSMLLVDDATARSGGICRVAQACGPSGERFALKTLQIGDEDASSDRGEVLRSAFDEEYRIHRKLEGLRGFPRLFGRGVADGSPAIVMEWIDGVTLEQAARKLAADDAGRVCPLWAARLGRDLFDLLDRMAYVDGTVVHRDISPRNIMVDLSQMSLQEQADEGVFELRVVDFGSAALVRDERGARRGPVLRSGATLAYAPPELLASADRRGVHASPSMDVYAAASVLYALVEGRPPFDMDALAADGEKAFDLVRRQKESGRPRGMVGAHGGAPDVEHVLGFEPEVAVAVGRAAAQLDGAPSANQVRTALMAVDAQLDEVVLSCLQPDPAKRLSATEAKGALAAFSQNYAGNIAHALAGEPLEPCMGEGRRARGGRRTLRAFAINGLRALDAALCAAVAAVAGTLANGMAVSLPVGGVLWEGPVPGAAVAAGVALPLVLGLFARWSARSRRGFVRGAAGCLAGAAVSGAAIALTGWPDPAVPSALGAALVLCAAASMAWITGDYLLAKPEAKATAVPVALPLGPGAAPPSVAAGGEGGSPALEDGAEAAETCLLEAVPAVGAGAGMEPDDLVAPDGGAETEELV